MRGHVFSEVLVKLHLGGIRQRTSRGIVILVNQHDAGPPLLEMPFDGVQEVDRGNLLLVVVGPVDLEPLEEFAPREVEEAPYICGIEPDGDSGRSLTLRRKNPALSSGLATGRITCESEVLGFVAPSDGRMSFSVAPDWSV